MSADGDKVSDVVSRLFDGFYEAAKTAKSTQKQNDNEEQDDEEEEGDDIFEVDYIMDTKVKKGVRYFYVRWKGYDESEDSWEPEENVAGAKKIVENFMASYKPRGRPPKTVVPKPPSLPRKRLESSKDKEPEDRSESDDEEYGKNKRKKKKTVQTPSTSKTPPQPKVENYTSVSALNTVIKRKIKSNLRWLGDDDSDERSSDNEAKTPVVNIPAKPSIRLESPEKINEVVEEATTEKTKEKKKKKKSKKHTKDKERSSSPPDTNKPWMPPLDKTPTSNSKVTILGVYRPENASRDEFRFIVRNNVTNQESIMTLAEAYLTDGWQLVRYLASKIHFQANGEHRIDLPNGEPKK